MDRRSGLLCTISMMVVAGLSACATGRTVPSATDVGFQPGLVRTDAGTCSAHGGIVDEEPADGAPDSSIVDCRIGTPMAAYRCEGGRYLFRLRQDDSDADILQRSADQYEAVTREIVTTGTRWTGEHVTVVETDHGVIVTTAEQRTVCDSEAIDALSLSARAR